MQHKHSKILNNIFDSTSYTLYLLSEQRNTYLLRHNSVELSTIRLPYDYTLEDLKGCAQIPPKEIDCIYSHLASEWHLESQGNVLYKIIWMEGEIEINGRTERIRKATNTGPLIVEEGTERLKANMETVLNTSWQWAILTTPKAPRED